jgi:UDP-N-acetylmuramoyl-tripeptide--D-alanyl-D-alanine ligase
LFGRFYFHPCLIGKSTQMDLQFLYSIFIDHPAISTDTRKIIPGSIFFALRGEHFDGNTFALQALQQGAAFAVVSDHSLKDPRLILVEDALKTLQDLAAYHRKKLKIPVLAITGSNGKTTTKELITAVLAKRYKVHSTTGNLNNHIGVPLTLLSAKKETDIIVCEMGANHIGEIAFLCTIAAPTHGIITNIGKAHLEGFGSLEGVRKAKGELFEFLQENDGLAFVNMDDPNLRILGEKVNHTRTYGFDSAFDPEIHFTYEAREGQQGFTLKDTRSEFEIRSSMFGHYNAINMLAAYTVGNYFQVDVKDIGESLSGFVPGANRSEIVNHKGCLIIKDAYNANPSSMELAIQAFATQYPEGWIVLGDMKELGDVSPVAHLQIIRQVTALPFSRMYLVGNAFSNAFQLASMLDPRITLADTIESIKESWSWEECRGQSILLKGSRSMHLELLLEP